VTRCKKLSTFLDGWQYGCDVDSAWLQCPPGGFCIGTWTSLSKSELPRSHWGRRSAQKQTQTHKARWWHWWVRRSLLLIRLAKPRVQYRSVCEGQFMQGTMYYWYENIGLCSIKIHTSRNTKFGEVRQNDHLYKTDGQGAISIFVPATFWLRTEREDESASRFRH